MSSDYVRTPEPQIIRIRKSDGELLNLMSGMETYPLAEPIHADRDIVLALPMLPREGAEIGVYDAETHELIKVVKLGPKETSEYYVKPTRVVEEPLPEPFFDEYDFIDLGDD